MTTSTAFGTVITALRHHGCIDDRAFTEFGDRLERAYRQRTRGNLARLADHLQAYAHTARNIAGKPGQTSDNRETLRTCADRLDKSAQMFRTLSPKAA